MSSKIEELIEKLAEQYPDSDHTLTVEDFACWLQKNAAPVVERQIKDVHTEHCCSVHGCKYGNHDTCTVTTGKASQSFQCEDCEDETPSAPPELAELQATIARLTAELLCPICEGSGEGWILSDSSHDAHNIQVDCQECNGRGSLLGAYESMRDQLISLNERYIKAGGDLLFIRAEIEQLKGGQGKPVAYLRNEGTPNNLVMSGFGQPDAFKVFKAQPAPLSVVLPERVNVSSKSVPFRNNYIADGYISGWNACLDKVKELNG